MLHCNNANCGIVNSNKANCNKVNLHNVAVRDVKHITVNLSSCDLSDSDVSILDKGLNFIPTPKILPVKTILESKNNLVCRIKLKSSFKIVIDPLTLKLKRLEKNPIGRPVRFYFQRIFCRRLVALKNALLTLLKIVIKLRVGPGLILN